MSTVKVHNINIRNLSIETHRALKLRAAKHGCTAFNV